jgi:hypothetical protein
MKTTIKIIPILLILQLVTSCYGINSKTSQIGDLDDTCRDKNAWSELTEIYSVDSTTPPEFIEAIDRVRNHHTKPEYILYFEDEPREVIGSDYYSVRVVYNPNLSNQILDGLTPKLSDKEQVRIRNRVQKVLMEYQCEKGKKKSRELFKRPAIFSKEFYDL